MLAQTKGAAMDDFYHDGNRAMQDSFASRALADRLAGRARRAFSDDDRGFVESAIYFFLATADAQGRPDCSYKGGPLGFVRVIGPSELAFPDYDGNGMFKSLGNLVENGNLGMLFMTMDGAPRRLRVNGEATVSDDDPLLGQMVGAQLVVRVKVRAIFPNCPRYVPDLESGQEARHAPRAGIETPEAEWKRMEMIADVVPPRRDTFRG
jgi:predicted pyridoxine 5'-phosphate oxidase superfamily flavin-nucleotide-binding protein